MNKSLYYHPEYNILGLLSPDQNLIKGEEDYINYALTDKWILIDDSFRDSEVCPIVTLAKEKLYFRDKYGRVYEIGV